MKPLNLFYEEPNPDRWVRFDRYPRAVVRRIIRGRPRIGGQQRVFVNLCAGLDQLDIHYRINDYSYIRRHTDELACIVGKPHVLDRLRWRNPILFGAATFAHPIDYPDFFARYATVRKILVPGEWMRQMFIQYYPVDRVVVWPVGIDTDQWSPSHNAAKARFDFLIYDKIMWRREHYEAELLQPIRDTLKTAGLTAVEIRYGHYREEQYRGLLQDVRGMIFLVEHETQGIAYQQALASGVPLLAWDRGGFWQDPEFYPCRVKYEPVTSVPYWDERCGMKFSRIQDFKPILDGFLEALRTSKFSPREFILENLTLAACARRYAKIAEQLQSI